jgi:hypothetical protein
MQANPKGFLEVSWSDPGTGASPLPRARFNANLILSDALAVHTCARFPVHVSSDCLPCFFEPGGRAGALIVIFVLDAFAKQPLACHELLPADGEFLL